MVSFVRSHQLIFFLFENYQNEFLYYGSLCRVYLAVQLLSTTNANAIEKLFKEGFDGELKNFKELADFIRIADQ